MESNYQRLLDILEDFECQHCLGTGTVDDAEPGDIRYNTYTCKECQGSGIRNNQALYLKVLHNGREEDAAEVCKPEC